MIIIYLRETEKLEDRLAHDKDGGPEESYLAKSEELMNLVGGVNVPAMNLIEPRGR